MFLSCTNCKPSEANTWFWARNWLDCMLRSKPGYTIDCVEVWHCGIAAVTQVKTWIFLSLLVLNVTESSRDSTCACYNYDLTSDFPQLFSFSEAKLDAHFLHWISKTSASSVMAAQCVCTLSSFLWTLYPDVDLHKNVDYDCDSIQVE